MTHPRSWSTTTVRYLWPFLQDVSSMPIRTSPSKRLRAPSASSSRLSALLQMLPTVCQSMRMSSETDFMEQCTASHATWSSNSAVNLDPGSAQGTEAVRIPCPGHLTRTGVHSMHAGMAPRSMVRHLLGCLAWS